MKSQGKQSQSSNINSNKNIFVTNVKSQKDDQEKSKSLFKVNSSQKKLNRSDSNAISYLSNSNFKSVDKSKNKSLNNTSVYSKDNNDKYPLAIKTSDIRKITFSVKKIPISEDKENNNCLESKFMTEIKEKQKIHNDRINSLIEKISNFHNEIIVKKDDSNIQSLISFFKENDLFNGIFNESNYLESLNNFEDEIMIKYPKVLNLLIAITKYNNNKIHEELNQKNVINEVNKNEVSTQLSLFIQSNPILKIIADDDKESFMTNKVKKSFTKESEISRGFKNDNEKRINSKVESERDLCGTSVNTLKTDYKIFNNPFKLNNNNINTNVNANANLPYTSFKSKTPAFDSQSNNTINTYSTIKTIDTGLYKTLNKVKPNGNNYMNSNIAVWNSEINCKFNRGNNLSHVSDDNEHNEEFELTDLSFNKSDSNLKENKNQLMTEVKNKNNNPITCSISPLVKPMLSFNPCKIFEKFDNDGKRIQETSYNLEDSFIPNEDVDLENLLNKNNASQENLDEKEKKEHIGIYDDGVNNENIVNNLQNTVTNNINSNSNDYKSQNLSNLDTTRGIVSQSIFESNSALNNDINDQNDDKENRFEIVNTNVNNFDKTNIKKNENKSKKIIDSLNKKYNTKSKQDTSFINENSIDINNLVLTIDPTKHNGSKEFLNVDNDNQNFDKIYTNYKSVNLNNQNIEPLKYRTCYKTNTLNNCEFNNVISTKNNKVDINGNDNTNGEFNYLEKDNNKESASNSNINLNHSILHNKSFCSLNKTIKSDKRNSNNHTFEHNPIFDVGYPILTSNSLAKHKESIINSLNNSDHKLNSSGIRSRNLVFEEKMMSNSLNGIKEENDAVIEL